MMYHINAKYKNGDSFFQSFIPVQELPKVIREIIKDDKIDKETVDIDSYNEIKIKK